MASMSTSTSFRSRALRASASSGVSPSTGGAPARASRLTSTTAAARRMANTPGYAKVADADNIRIFHGREVRQAGSS